MGKTWDYLLINPQLIWWDLLRMVILDNKGVFYLASRCKRVCDALPEIPGTCGIIDSFVRNGILANSLPLFLELIIRLLGSSNNSYPSLIHTVYSLASDFFECRIIHERLSFISLLVWLTMRFGACVLSRGTSTMGVGCPYNMYKSDLKSDSSSRKH